MGESGREEEEEKEGVGGEDGGREGGRKATVRMNKDGAHTLPVESIK